MARDYNIKGALEMKISFACFIIYTEPYHIYKLFVFVFEVISCQQDSLELDPFATASLTLSLQACGMFSGSISDGNRVLLSGFLMSVGFLCGLPSQSVSSSIV